MHSRHPMASALVDCSLLVDRFLVVTGGEDGAQLVPKREVRFQRSRSRTRGEGPKDTLGAQDLDQQPFLEPTRVLRFVPALTDGRFAALLVPTQVASVSRWQLFAHNARSGAIDAFSIERSTDGLFNTRGETFLTCVDHPDVFALDPGRVPRRRSAPRHRRAGASSSRSPTRAATRAPRSTCPRRARSSSSTIPSRSARASRSSCGSRRPPRRAPTEPRSSAPARGDRGRRPLGGGVVQRCLRIGWATARGFAPRSRRPCSRRAAGSTSRPASTALGPRVRRWPALSSQRRAARPRAGRGRGDDAARSARERLRRHGRRAADLGLHARARDIRTRSAAG